MSAEDHVLKILAASAKRNGWKHRGTLQGWRKGGAIFIGYLTNNSSPPDVCTFWFHLETDENAIVGFDWDRRKPDKVTTVDGEVSLVPINLSYTSSHKQLNKFFEDAKKQFTRPKNNRNLFSKLGSLLNRRSK